MGASTRPLQYRKGKKLPVTEEWKARVLVRLAELEKSQQWLEEQLGCKKGTLHRLLHKQQSSILIAPVCRVLEIDHPIDEEDKTLAELIAICRKWTPEQRESLVSFLKTNSKAIVN